MSSITSHESDEHGPSATVAQGTRHPATTRESAASVNTKAATAEGWRLSYVVEEEEVPFAVQLPPIFLPQHDLTKEE